MRIAYCANVRLPSERAHGHQIAQVCDAFVTLGHSVTVFATIRKETVEEPFSSYYGVSEKIALKHIGFARHIPNWPPLRPLRLFIQNYGLMQAYKKELTRDAFDLLYTRTPALLPTLIATGIPVILELHQLPRLGGGSFVRSCMQCSLVACLTSRMRDELIAMGVNAFKVIVAPDAYDARLFSKEISSADARKEFGITNGAPVIGYAGQLASVFSKGIPEMIEALTELNRRGVAFQAVIAGGPDAARENFERTLPQEIAAYVRFIGNVARTKIPSFLSACDILVYPAPKSDHPYYQRDVSPLKLFEYMAASRPIVCADLPPLRDIVDEKSVFFCKPGDAKSCADAMQQAMTDAASAKVTEARKRVEDHTWEKRMNMILSTHTSHS